MRCGIVHPAPGKGGVGELGESWECLWGAIGEGVFAWPSDVRAHVVWIPYVPRLCLHALL